MRNDINILVIYPYIPHYRIPVFNQLGESSKELKYKLLYSSNTIERSINSSVDSLKCASKKIFGFSVGLFFIQWIPLKYFSNRMPDVVIFLGNPYFLSTWVYALVYRFIFRRKVIFWTHGWLDHEVGPKAFLRRVFYSIANHLFLYGNRAKEIGFRSGLSRKSMVVVFNSLAFEVHDSRYFEIANNSDEQAQLLPFGIIGDEIYFCCVARVTNLCRFDIAVRALARIREFTKKSYKFVLIGDGPEVEPLKVLAEGLGVSLHFIGETYDEAIISRVLYFSRAIVSPGKAGLSVMHGLSYGSPVISHNCWKYQMPEAEAIVDGVSGSLIEFDSVDSMVGAMLSWIHKPRSTQERDACRRVIIDYYNPKVQARIINSALLKLFD